VDVGDGGHGGVDGGAVGDRLYAQGLGIHLAAAGAVGGDDGAFLLDGRIVEHMFEQEPVQLGLGQGIGALLLDRVLGGDHGEAVAERVGYAVNGDLTLLHGFQQRGLSLGRGAVDLVGQQQFAEDRTPRQGEAGGLEVEQVGPDDVAGHQVGRELDPAIVQADRAGKALGQQGLGGPGRTLQQDVAAGEQGGQQQVHGSVLADHGAGDLGANPRGDGGHLIDVHGSAPVSSDRGRARPSSDHGGSLRSGRSRPGRNSGRSRRS
jgi:hypothetical protein